jgi:hypothetical protein
MGSGWIAKARLWALAGGLLAGAAWAAPLSGPAAAPAGPAGQGAVAPAPSSRPDSARPAASGPSVDAVQPAPSAPDPSHPAAPVPAALPDSARPAKAAPAASPADVHPETTPAAPAHPSAARAAFRPKGNAADTSRPRSVFRFVPPVLTRQDSLFLAAATGEPRFQPVRDSAERILVAEDTATLDYLVARRLVDQTPRQRHYVETLFKAISDSGRHPAAAARLGAALAVAPDSVKPQLLHIGSELGDSSFLKIARRYLDHDSEEIRKNAVRSLGAYPSGANAAWLVAGLEKTRGLERAERLWALGRQKDFREWPRVLPYLNDENLYNRELARRIVAVSCGDWSNVEKLAPAEMDDDTLLEWILMAEESPGLSAKIWVRKRVPQLSPARMKFIGSALRLQ